MINLSVIGNLGADAEIRVVNGERFVSFNVAHTFRRVDRQTGAVQETTLWVSCALDGERPNLMPFLVKGAKVYVQGTPNVRVYMGADGHHHAALNLSANYIELCGTRSEKLASDEKHETDLAEEQPF